MTDLTLDLIRPLLPRRVAELAEVAGLAAALKLVELRGGRRVYIPKTADAGHWLAEHIGLPALAVLAARYGGADMEIDRCCGLRRALVVAEYERGVPVSVLAERYGCTERAIRYMTVAASAKLPARLAEQMNMDWIDQYL